MAIPYNANYNETMPFSDTCLQVSLTANVAQDYLIPGTATTQYQAYFEYASNSNVFVCNNGIAEVPVSGTKARQQYNEFKPKKRYVNGGDTLTFITPDVGGAFMGVSLRQL